MKATARPDVDARTEHLVARCREAGLTVTPQRLAIFRALVASEDHPSPETLHARVRKQLPTLSLATIYKTLDALVELGVIEEVSPVSAVKRYDGNGDHHHHLICVRCKTVTDFYDPKLDALQPPRRQLGGFVPQVLTVQVKGLCAACDRLKR